LGQHKSVGEGVQEIVLDYGPGYRIYFGEHGATLFVLLLGSKKTAGRSHQVGDAVLERLEGKDFAMKARRKKVYPASRAYEKGLDKRLKSPEFAIEYLNAILEDNDPDLLLLGLRDVARVYGFAHIAESTGLNRESLYKALSKGRNPRIGTIMNVLSAMGCSIRLEPAKKTRRKAALETGSDYSSQTFFSARCNVKV